jgi:hypothetical protein
MFRGFTTRGLVIGAAVLTVAGAGVGVAAYAASSSTTRAVAGPYHVCVDRETHRVTTIWGNDDTPTCKTGKLLFDWKRVGERGPRGPRGPQGPAGVSAPTWRSEVDNGAQFSLSSGPLGDTSAPAATYADAGVVVDVGATDDLTLSSFAYDGDGPLTVNVWIGDGPQASTPGTYQLDSVDFCYGLGQVTAGSLTGFQMNSGCGDDAGKTLTVADLASHYPGLEAYAWVGVTGPDSGNSTSASVVSVDGQHVGATVGVRVNADTTMTAYVS